MRFFRWHPKPSRHAVVRIWDGGQWLYCHAFHDPRPVEDLVADLQEEYPGCPIEVVDGYRDGTR
jgi:hypothetical protein